MSALLLSFAAGSCAAPATPLPGGCYYLRGAPVFRISGSHGEVLLRGPVRSFHAETNGDRAFFTPGFLLDGDTRPGSLASPLHAQADAPGTRSYRVVSGRPTMTLELNFAAYGEAEVALGPPC